MAFFSAFNVHRGSLASFKCCKAIPASNPGLALRLFGTCMALVFGISGVQRNCCLFIFLLRNYYKKSDVNAFSVFFLHPREN